MGFRVGLRYQLRGKRAELLYNRQVVEVLVRYGMTRSAEVFSNDWDIYNLADPKFDTFYNYGGWILLDSQYAAERPPPRASTLDEWKSFFATHGIRFAILKRRPDTEEIFTRTPPKWKRIFEDSRFTIFAFEAH